MGHGTNQDRRQDVGGVRSGEGDEGEEEDGGEEEEEEDEIVRCCVERVKLTSSEY